MQDKNMNNVRRRKSIIISLNRPKEACTAVVAQERKIRRRRSRSRSRSRSKEQEQEQTPGYR